MSQLTAAKEALKKRGPKKTYRVTFEQIETFSVEIEAVDRDTASEEATEIFNDGNAHSNGDSGGSQINIEEIPS